MDGKQNAHIFAKNTYFSKVYPMDSKIKSGDDLKLFCKKLGVPEKLAFDGSN